MGFLLRYLHLFIWTDTCTLFNISWFRHNHENCVVHSWMQDEISRELEDDERSAKSNSRCKTVVLFCKEKKKDIDGKKIQFKNVKKDFV